MGNYTGSGSRMMYYLASVAFAFTLGSTSPSFSKEPKVEPQPIRCYKLSRQLEDKIKDYNSSMRDFRAKRDKFDRLESISTESEKKIAALTLANAINHHLKAFEDLDKFEGYAKSQGCDFPDILHKQIIK